MGTQKTIKIKKYLDIVEEYEAVAALYPGHLLELTTAGKVQKHSDASGEVVAAFALEDELQGNGIDDAYAAADKVQVWYPTKGEVVNAVLADGENASIGSLLVSNGDGTLAVYTEPDSFDVHAPLMVVGQAIEAVDLSDSSGAEDSGALDWDKRICIRIV